MLSPCHCAVLRRAARKLSAAYDTALEPLGINIAQYGLLRSIAPRPTMSLTALGQAQGLERSTVGRNVKVLERMELVITRRGDDDQREVMVSLTEAGRSLLAEALPAWESCQHALGEKLGAERLGTLRDILAEI